MRFDFSLWLSLFRVKVTRCRRPPESKLTLLRAEPLPVLGNIAEHVDEMRLSTQLAASLGHMEGGKGVRRGGGSCHSGCGGF